MCEKFKVLKEELVVITNICKKKEERLVAMAVKCELKEEKIAAMAVRKLEAMATKIKRKEELEAVLDLCGENEQKLVSMDQLDQEKEAALQHSVSMLFMGQAQEEAQQLQMEEYRKTICALKREMEGNENTTTALVEFHKE
ncbi:hypothetical protein AAFF_G00177550 [Aldrovandia affinis]|uniref:Uncharacterized protein n=1 Tax=Aldrovandia affinis TaxID=143900 RepID=A0AAD7W6H7_9TELE|nr:hypothetical protein AAFF_G00177550 [Aldrovandia affinis]